jgi:hypothetical protein
MKLHQIHGRNKYCGPSAISAITGYSSDDAARVIRHHSGQRAVKGAHQRHVTAALRDFGIQSDLIYDAPRGKGCTFAQWLNNSVDRRKSGIVFLLVSGWHYQVVSGRKATCGRIRDIVSIRDKSLKQRSRVAQVWQLSLNEYRISKPDLLKRRDEMRKKRSVDPERAAYAKARRLMKQHDMQVDIDRVCAEVVHYWVYADDATEARADYPWEGDHIVRDWIEVLRRIEDIIEFKKTRSRSILLD